MTATAIAAVVPRKRTELVGRVTSVSAHVRPWVWFDAILDDGTGTVTLRFTGRQSVPGITEGRRLNAEGTPGRVGESLVMLNPVYEFVPDEAQTRRRKDCDQNRAKVASDSHSPSLSAVSAEGEGQ